MRFRLVAATAVAVAVAALVPPAGAVPTADPVGGVEAHLSFFGRDRSSYLVDLQARVPAAGPSAGTGTLEVTLRRCGGYACSKPVTYRSAVSDAQLTVAQDMTAGTLLTSMFGRPLSLRWFAAQPQPLASYETEPRPYVRLYRVTMVQGVLAGIKCVSKEALVFQEERVDLEPAAAPPAALPRSAPRAFAGMLGGSCQSVL
jgi:hypothetical protein